MLHRLYLSLILVFLTLSLKSQYLVNTRYNNSCNDMRLKGKVKQLKQTKYETLKEGDLIKKVVDVVILYKFNEAGNITEQVQYGAKGNELLREVYGYESGRLISHKIYRNGSKMPQYEDRCVTDVVKNTLTTQMTIPGMQGVFSTTVQTYNTKGQLISEIIKQSGKTTGTTKKYDAVKNTVRTTDIDKGSYYDEVYDKNQFLIEVRYYNADNKVGTCDYSKYDAFGNEIESYYVNKVTDFTSSVNHNLYTYDSHKNWISKTSKSNSYTKREERVIEYYRNDNTKKQ